jgi:hypothetical protein
MKIFQNEIMVICSLERHHVKFVHRRIFYIAGPPFCLPSFGH